jgi:hypothetical protein
MMCLVRRIALAFNIPSTYDMYRGACRVPSTTQKYNRCLRYPDLTAVMHYPWGTQLQVCCWCQPQHSRWTTLLTEGKPPKT